MKSRFLQAFLAGLVVVLVFVCSVTILDVVLRHLFPHLFAGMGSLIFGPPETIIVLLVGLTLSIISGRWLLRQWSGNNRLWVMLPGGTAVLAWSVALLYTFPGTNRYAIVAGAALAGGMIFTIAAAILSTRVVYRLILSLLLIGGGVWVALVQYHSGTQRSQLEGLKHTGYVVYAPTNTSRYHATSITPVNGRYDGYKDGVTVNLADGGNVTEQRVDHRPAADCGEPFIVAENSYNTDSSTPLKDFSCQLVASKNGVNVYMLERKTYASYYDDYDVDRVYFAVAGNTFIYGGPVLSVHSVIDPQVQSTAEQIQAFNDSKSMLLDLAPVGDFSYYLQKR